MYQICFYNELLLVQDTLDAISKWAGKFPETWICMGVKDHNMSMGYDFYEAIVVILHNPLLHLSSN